jgi:hypothetical protein
VNVYVAILVHMEKSSKHEEEVKSKHLPEKTASFSMVTK